MSHRPVASDRAALELALFGVTGHAVADVLCR
ncbi:Ms4533A family Cys-rich leader peptide [Streptomyces sp. NPDC048018]